MKARFQIFKAPFYFVGWLAPAYGKDAVNPNGITTGKTQSIPTVSQPYFSILKILFMLQRQEKILYHNQISREPINRAKQLRAEPFRSLMFL